MLSRAEEKLVRALQRRKIREAEHLFLAEGVRVVEALLASGIDLHLALLAPSLGDTSRGHALAQRLQASGTAREIDERDLDALAATESPQGVLAVAAMPRHELEAMDVDGAGVVVALDAIQDPGNFGVVVRSADAFGALFVAALPGTVDPWNPKAVRSAAGSSFHLPVLQVGTGPLVAWLRERGFTIYGADAAGTSAEALALAQRAALVFGNEGAGIGAEVRSAIDELLAVPMRGGAESLNVGVAAGVLLYLLTRSR